MDQPKIERVLRLMRLMGGNVNFSVDELARKMNTSYRTIYRYIDTFKEAGFAVERIHGNYYRILKMPRAFKDLENLVYFSEEEARVLAALIQGIHDSNVLKGNLYNKISAICDVTDVERFIDDKQTALSVKILGEAIEDHRQVVLRDYSSASSGTVRDRIVEPFGFTGEYAELWAYDVEKKDNRLFKTSRIGGVDTLLTDWEFESEHRKGKLDAFGMQGFTQTHVRLEMTLRAKNLLLEEHPMAMNDVHEENGKWVYDSQVSSMAGIGRFVIGLAKEIKIVDSPELSEYIAEYRKYVNKL